MKKNKKIKNDVVNGSLILDGKEYLAFEVDNLDNSEVSEYVIEAVLEGIKQTINEYRKEKYTAKKKIKKS
jgi:hypothetical protein